jgi:hypothetical protein
MSYNRSEQHYQNLEKARRAAVRKEACRYCSAERTLGNIKKHEASCHLNPSNLKPCIVCDSPIKNYKTSATCGYGCANTHFRSGPDSANWKESRYRSTCFHFHSKRCVVCDEENIVEVHHLDGDNSNNEPGNLIPLCPNHHQYWHSRFRHLVEAKIMAYIDAWRKRQ